MFVSYLRWSLEGILFALMYPGCWIGLLGVAFAPYAAQRRNLSDGQATGVELLTLVVGPLLLLAWGLLLRDSIAGRPRGLTWQSAGLLVIFGAVCLCAWAMTWRHRRRLAVVLPLAALSVLWGGGALFVASMSISNDWL
jgi:hypothetical protein